MNFNFFFFFFFFKFGLGCLGVLVFLIVCYCICLSGWIDPWMFMADLQKEKQRITPTYLSFLDICFIIIEFWLKLFRHICFLLKTFSFIAPSVNLFGQNCLDWRLYTRLNHHKGHYLLDCEQEKYEVMCLFSGYLICLHEREFTNP